MWDLGTVMLRWCMICSGFGWSGVLSGCNLFRSEPGSSTPFPSRSSSGGTHQPKKPTTRILLQNHKNVSRRSRRSVSVVSDSRSVVDASPNSQHRLFLYAEHVEKSDVSAKPAEHVSLLLKMLKHRNKAIRASAARSLGEIEKPSAQIFEALEQALLDRERVVGYGAVHALGMLAEHSVRARRRLRLCLRSPVMVIQFAAIQAWGRLKVPHPDAVPDLVALLDSKHTDLQCESARVLGKIGLIDAAIPGLQRMLGHAQGFVVLCASLSLRTMGAGSVKIQSSLVRVLTHPNIEVRKAVLRTLAAQEAQARPVAVVMSQRLWDDDILVRVVAAKALARVKSPHPHVLRALEQALLQQDAEVRAATALALGATRISWASVLSKLRAMTHAPEYDVRRAAQKALLQLSPLSTSQPTSIPSNKK